jgi:hypothetical protein
MDSDAITDRATEMGEQHAAEYLARFGRYPSVDDDEEFTSGLWPAAWEELMGLGATDDLWEACVESWRVGYLGPRA